MEYEITFSDVMALVITGALGLLAWFLKNYLSDIQKTNDYQNKKLGEIDEKFDKRIAAVEQESRKELKRVDREIADMKSDFATMFVLREDYFRAMDKMDTNFRDIDRKIDRLLQASNISMEVRGYGRSGDGAGASEQSEPGLYHEGSCKGV